MKLTDEEIRMLNGEYGEQIAFAIDKVIQFGDAFGAERLVDIIYAHYPAEMSIYPGIVEDVVEYSKTGAKVKVPTTTSTLACDLQQWKNYGCPEPIFSLQNQVIDAHQRMGLIGTYTCTPQFLGFVPLKGSYIVSVESSAIIYFNSVLGARTNRGGMITRYSAVCGKYPLMGYLLDENRKGTHLFKIKLSESDLTHDSDYSALGFHVGGIVGSEVPVFDYLGTPTQSNLLALGATLATTGSVALFHAPPHTAEAKTIDEAFQGTQPKEIHEVTIDDIREAHKKLTAITPGEDIDFVTLGCPHYTLDKIRYVADWIDSNGGKFHPNVRVWLCTNRMTRNQAEYEGLVNRIQNAGGTVIADSCPVESHMRTSTCREFNLKIPQIDSMVTDSAKMARYVKDLIGCRTALINREKCLESAVSGKFTGI